MSQYSEMMGSFIRTGNYPLEAHYIFPTEEALKEFYSDEMNATTIHKGLLRIVENDGTGKQGLYWVTKKQTNDDLEFTKLISGTNIDSIFEQLDSLETRLAQEIKNRKDSETAIWGTNDPTNVPEELNSILDLATVISALKVEVANIHAELVDSDDSIYKSLKTEVKAVAGTQEYDVVEYLRTLPYKSLTEVANALNKFLNETDSTTNQINTLPELKFFLEGYTDTQKLRHVLLDLQAEILGNPLPTEDFRTLRAIEDFVRILKANSENTDKNLQSELDRTQVGVGLSGDGSYNADKETYYLGDATSIMNALKILDGLMYEAISGITIEPYNNDVVDLNVRKELEGYIISAKLNLSNQLGNDLIKKEDGLYFNVDSTYKDGVLSLYVNGKLIAQHILGFSSLVDTAQYDPSQEAIVIVFKLLNGDKQTITIPVGALIREWVIDNSQPNKVVELVRETTVDGPDTLSADVRLWTDKTNILRKYGNTLGVEGTSENITHNDETLKVFLESFKATVTGNNTTLTNKIDSEIARATAKEGLIETALNTAKSDLETAIDEVEDASQLKDAELEAAIKAEVNRATAEENNLKQSVTDLKAADSEIRQTNEEQNSKIAKLDKDLSDTNHAIELEEERATNVETNITKRVDSFETELSGISKKQIELDAKVDTQKAELIHEVHLISDEVDEKIESKADKSVIDDIQQKTDDTALSLNNEILRASSKEGELQTAINNLSADTTQKIIDTNSKITDFNTKVQEEVSRAKGVEGELKAQIATLTSETATSLAKKVESVALDKVDDLTYSLLVNGANIGQIVIPKDQFLKSVTVVNDSVLRFVFNTDAGTTTTDIDIAPIVATALDELTKRVEVLEADKAPIYSPTFTGIPQVETSPDAADASQRIPSTNWVKERLEELLSKINNEMFYTKPEIVALLEKKADLVNGIVPESQLPKLYIIEVE